MEIDFGESLNGLHAILDAAIQGIISNRAENSATLSEYIDQIVRSLISKLELRGSSNFAKDLDTIDQFQKLRIRLSAHLIVLSREDYRGDDAFNSNCLARAAEIADDSCRFTTLRNKLNSKGQDHA